VYLIAPLALLHYAWSKKGDIFVLQGDILRPLSYTLVFLVFMLLRITPVKRFLAAAWSKVASMPGRVSQAK
jgi:DMSO/TMAO reductase YedYZ heme-binding membrane subunit